MQKGVILNLLPILLLLYACGNDRGRDNTKEEIVESEINTSTKEKKENKISHVSFFIENSGSMFGYVNGSSSFVNAVNDMAQFSSLVKAGTEFSYFLVSGSGHDFKTYPLGNDPNTLKAQLNIKHFRKPSSGSSDLNRMFAMALHKAVSDSISILISDGIYAVNKADDPQKALATEGITTRTTFINRLMEDDIQTLVLKMNSNFRGKFYPGSEFSEEIIDHQRPYYIWVFGRSDLLNEFLSEDRLNNLQGFNDIARFQKMKMHEVKYKAIGFENSGLRPVLGKINELEVVRSSSRTSSAASLSIAVDFSGIDIPSSYLEDVRNYEIADGYQIDGVLSSAVFPSKLTTRYLNNLGQVTTHVIQISSINTAQLGLLDIKIKVKDPEWILESSSNDDHPLKGNSTQTFGFSTLMKGISEAYKEQSNVDYLCQIILTIKN
jgi:hypothetical protein